MKIIVILLCLIISNIYGNSEEECYDNLTVLEHTSAGHLKNPIKVCVDNTQYCDKYEWFQMSCCFTCQIFYVSKKAFFALQNSLEIPCSCQNYPIGKDDVLRGQLVCQTKERVCEQVDDLTNCYNHEQLGGKVCPACIPTLLNVPESSRVYSSTYNAPSCKESMLDGSKAWCGSKAVAGDTLTFDLGSNLYITGIATQRRPGNPQRVTNYKVKYSQIKTDWSEGQSQQSWFWAERYVTAGSLWAERYVYQGNVDDNEDKKLNLFVKPIKARYVRIIVEDFEVHPSMRVGIFTCGIGMSNISPNSLMLTHPLVNNPAINANNNNNNFNYTLGFFISIGVSVLFMIIGALVSYIYFSKQRNKNNNNSVYDANYDVMLTD